MKIILCLVTLAFSISASAKDEFMQYNCVDPNNNINVVNVIVTSEQTENEKRARMIVTRAETNQSSVKDRVETFYMDGKTHNLDDEIQYLMKTPSDWAFKNKTFIFGLFKGTDLFGLRGIALIDEDVVYHESELILDSDLNPIQNEIRYNCTEKK